MSPTDRSNHQIAVLVLEGAKPLDVGIPAQVFSNRPSMPYEVRVCGAAPGLVTGGDGLSYHVAEGLDALERADTVFVPGYRTPADADPPGVVVDALKAAHARGRGWPRSRPGRSRSRRPACSTGGARPPTGTTPGRCASGTRGCRSTRTCCSSTRAPC
nr:hypothetical protein GCM10025730_53130 [Promicromonospora thailandica]